MSRFNRTSSGATKTVNFAGGEAFIESPKLELVSLMLTSFVKDQYYRGTDESLSKVESLIDAIKDKKFIAKAAIYARNEFGMRSISHVVAAELAKRVKGEEWTKSFYEKVIHRPDDITEILSYYANKYGFPIPNSLKKGLAKSFGKFDEYQIAKYRGEGKEFSLIDAVNIVHPKANEKNSKALEALMKGKLRSFDTWEKELSETKGDEKLKKNVWVKLIRERKIGYFALLRNLRNIIEQSPEMLDEALEMLIDEKLIEKSLVLPFRFLTALDEIESLSGKNARKAIIALSKAVDISTKNVPKFEGNTLVVLDESGSMEGQPAKIGSLFAAILVKSNNADLMTFSNDARYRSINILDSVTSIANSIRFSGGGTNFHSIFQEANDSYDRIIILSDMQGWIGYENPSADFNEYKKRTGAKSKVYSFDLQGYGTLQFPERDVY